MAKIMVIGPDHPDSFADNVGDTLRRIGHDVLLAGSARLRLRSPRLSNAVNLLRERASNLDARMQRHLVSAAGEFGPQIVLSLERTVQPATVAALKRGGASVALWFPDAVSNLGRHDALLAPYDYFFFKNPLLVNQLRDVYGLPAVYLPEAANSSWHRSSADYGTDPSIVVAGNIHPSRGILLERMIRAGLPLRIFGSPPASWMSFPLVSQAHSGRYIARQEKADIFRGARAVLNNLHPAEFAGANCRLFEAAASGAAILTESRVGLDDVFVDGSEVLSFASFDDLVDQARVLLGDASIGAQVGDRAAVRAHRDHVYERRLDEILDLLVA